MSGNEVTLENIKQRFVQYSDELGKVILYHPTHQVQKIKDDEEIQNLLAEMKKAVRGFGVGLAANQIGQALQIFMLEFTTDKNSPAHTSRYELNLPDVPFQIFINPKITAASVEKIAFWHGCLSAADKLRGLVATYQWIEYEAQNERGEFIKGKLDGMGAVIFQHEFRHLLGTLYFDHATCFMSLKDLQDSFASGKMQPYQLATEDVPLLLADYKIGESVEEYSARK